MAGWKDSAKKSMSGSKKSSGSKKTLHEIRTRKGKSGGYIHEHHYKDPEQNPMEEHTSPDQASMLQHMADAMPQAAPSPDPTGATGAPGASGAAMPATPPAGAAPAGM